MHISENDAERGKPNSFTTHMTRDMGQIMLEIVTNNVRKTKRATFISTLLKSDGKHPLPQQRP